MIIAPEMPVQWPALHCLLTGTLHSGLLDHSAWRLWSKKESIYSQYHRCILHHFHFKRHGHCNTGHESKLLSISWQNSTKYAWLCHGEKSITASCTTPTLLPVFTRGWWENKVKRLSQMRPLWSNFFSLLLITVPTHGMCSLVRIPRVAGLFRTAARSLSNSWWKWTSKSN